MATTAASCFRSLVALVVCAALAACGDDDGQGPSHDAGVPAHDAALPDDASEPAPDAALGDDAGADDDDASAPEPFEETAYYPVTDGARWVYRHAGGARTWDEEVVLTHVRYQGAPAFMLRDTPGPSGTRSETVLGRDGSKISRVYREELRGDSLQTATTYEPGFVRFDHAWVAREDGYTETLRYDRVERDGTGAITADGDRSHRYVIEAHDAVVEVPAGTFEACLRVRRTRTRAVDTQPAEGDEDLFWFCPHVGKVREQDTVTLETEELVSYDVR